MTTTIVDDNTLVINIVPVQDASEGFDGSLTAEGEVNGLFEITLSNPSQNEIQVNVTDGIGNPLISSGTAESGGVAPGEDDYENFSSSTVTFFAGDQSENVVVDVIDDMAVEGTETVIASINLEEIDPDTLDSGDVTIGSGSATINIIDDDFATLTAEDVTVDEETGAITFTVTLDNDVIGGFDVDYDLTNVTTENADFTGALTGTLSFAGTAGETQTFTIGINDEMIVEGDETFTVGFSNVVPNGAPLPSQIVVTDEATGTITNTDTADLTVGDATVNEEAGTITFSVTLDNAVEGGFSVDYGTLDVTTESGDFTGPLTGTLNFAGTVGETQTITIGINNDAIVEGDETFTVSLSGVDTSCLLYTSPSPRDRTRSRMPSSA